MRAARLLLPFIAAVAFGHAALAADGDTLSTAESEKYGTYMVGPEGMPIYMFTTDTQGADGTEPAISCNAECLAAWPLVPVEGEPTAGEGVDAEMLGTMTHDGNTVATYNGWPVYTFVQDTAGEEPTGQDKQSFGGEWYLLGPDGEKIDEE